jgi:ABC-2 type transport system ATP-binding protein
MQSLIPARLAGVTKTYGDVAALAGIDIEVRPGETLALLGPNGAGKTTAIRIMLGLIRPTAGSVEVFGQDPRKAQVRARIGAMLQVGQLPDALTVREHVELFSSYYPHPLGLRDSLDYAGLTGLENRRAEKLSGGQRRRLFFALAICGNPDILFLDEPTTALDVESREALWARIDAFVEQGRSVVLTTHDMEEAEALARRVMILSNGRVIADAPTREITARIERQTIRCRSGFALDALRALPGIDAASRCNGETILVARDGDAVVRALYAGDPEFQLIDVASANLQDAFVSILDSAARSQQEVA